MPSHFFCNSRFLLSVIWDFKRLTFRKDPFVPTMPDLLSLPSDIVDQIVSLLPFREAVRTSTLSRSWHYVWTRTKILNFSPQSGPMYYRGVHLLGDIGFKNQETDRFVGWVRNTIRRHTGATLESFQISFPLDELQQESVDSWVLFALRKKTEDLIFNFSGLWNPVNAGDIFSTCYRLRVQHLPVALDRTACDTFGYLRTLSLQNVAVDGEEISFLVRNCQILQEVHLTCTPSLARMVLGNSHSLNVIKISNCHDIESIRISLPNLGTLSYHGGFVDLEIEDAPLLQILSLKEQPVVLHEAEDLRTTVFNRISSAIPQLTYLCLNFVGMNRINVHPVPALPNLKALRLILDPGEQMVLRQVSNFLRAAFTLPSFALQFAAPRFGDGQVVMPDALAVNSTINRIDFYGHISSNSAAALACYVRDCTPELETLTVHSRGLGGMLGLTVGLRLGG